ncbi:hypothetical protein CVT25_001614 [Psilocybe cyanescens]|uniref:Uncharacterized protein n=1 Tax=Psilocybe cyanescens TaxID=93625 RepID=A0A409WQ06_PSICY|nr:hypothetical protein CVT25_001614 [Psilocybe cyanescens]
MNNRQDETSDISGGGFSLYGFLQSGTPESPAPAPAPARALYLALGRHTTTFTVLAALVFVFVFGPVLRRISQARQKS